MALFAIFLFIYGIRNINKNTSKGILAIVFSLFIFVVLVLEGDRANKPTADVNKNSSSNTNRKQEVNPGDYKPPIQLKFENIIISYIQPFNNCTNELQESQIKTKRIGDLRKNNIITINNWVGKVADLGTTRNGDAYIDISIHRNINLKTWNNTLSDLGDNTLIKHGSNLYNKMLNLKKGDYVVFSGKFVKDESTFITEGSLRIKRELTSPEFIILLSDIKPFNEAIKNN